MMQRRNRMEKGMKRILLCRIRQTNRTDKQTGPKELNSVERPRACVPFDYRFQLLSGRRRSARTTRTTSAESTAAATTTESAACRRRRWRRGLSLATMTRPANYLRFAIESRRVDVLHHREHFSGRDLF